ncbi:NAD(P)/FAD-dependent oxidoreductase [Luteolibacter marinus]|uniref:NAD(P)/FAD-dependent oxidoreductase n=1 Tax=Luteolibacter marinus TaxID=2776705 RepID=UPI001868310B|nr:FAD-dependent oxidoreductase [Luteolibacter marinus]
MGLAGCCLAWQLSFAGRAFSWHDEVWDGASSRVAAGMINPVTGKNFNPSWRLAEFLPEAEAFFRKVGEITGRQLWFPFPVWRMAGEQEWPKFLEKIAAPETQPWVAGVEESVSGWRGAVVLRGGARVATRDFCEVTRAHFAAQQAEVAGAARLVLCEGAAGLIGGRLGHHRCAKGEILSLRAPSWRSDRMVIGAGGWLVPTGEGTFKAGSTYVWDRLDGTPTKEGREAVERIARRLGGDDFEVIDHEAGIRPIVRRSQPVIGPLPDGRVIFNGLGSKGSLYAPGVATRLERWLTGEAGLDPELDVGGL